MKQVIFLLFPGVEHQIYANNALSDVPDEVFCWLIHVETNHLFVHDKGIYTSAGIASGIDLSLALVEKHWDRIIGK